MRCHGQNVLTWSIVLCRIISYRIVLYRIVLCRIVSYRIVSQICCQVFKFGWASSNVPPLVGIGLIELPNSRWATAHPARSLAASLHCIDSYRILLYSIGLHRIISYQKK